MAVTQATVDAVRTLLAGYQEGMLGPDGHARLVEQLRWLANDLDLEAAGKAQPACCAPTGVCALPTGHTGAHAWITDEKIQTHSRLRRLELAVSELAWGHGRVTAILEGRAE